MSRSSLLLPMCVLLSLISLPAAADGKEKAAAARAYIETSYLLAPRQVGDFTLEGSSFDPAQKSAGAGFRYALADHQETRIDIYVYPAGRRSPDEALDIGMKELRGGLEQAAAQGTYTQLRELDETAFALAPGPTAGKTPANDFDAQVINAIAEAEQVTGRKLQMQMNLQPRDMPMHSNGYLFYKQLYYFKIRASAARERITQDDFNALTDRAARALIPALQVANVGGCADATIVLPADAPPEQGALALIRQTSVHKGYNCHRSAEEAGVTARRAASAVIEIPFTAEEWKSQ